MEMLSETLFKHLAAKQEPKWATATQCVTAAKWKQGIKGTFKWRGKLGGGEGLLKDWKWESVVYLRNIDGLLAILLFSTLICCKSGPFCNLVVVAHKDDKVCRVLK